MAFNRTLSAILRGRWLIDKSWADDHLPLVLLMLQGQPLPAKSFVERTGNMGVEQPFIINPSTGERYRMYLWVEGKGYVPNPNIPQNSVGIIPVSGAITKYNGDCGEPGSIQHNNWLMDMQKRDNVGSVILLLDTPGGEARAANTPVQTIQKFNKPIIGYSDGMIASLGVWYAAGCDEIHFSSEMDQIGSVGSYCTILDFRGYLEQNGVKLHEIYAPQSTDKNKDYRDAINGDYSAIEADLAKHVDAFISFVKTNRGDRATANEKAWNSGRMFYAPEAIKVGLGDTISSFDKVVSKAAWLGRRNK